MSNDGQLSVFVSLSFPLSSLSLSLSLSRDRPSYVRNKSYGKEEHDGLEAEDTEAT